MKQKYRMTFKCKCGGVFKKITTDPNLMSAACPECRSAERKTKLVRMGDGAVTDADLLAEKMVKKLMETPEFQERLLAKMMSPIPQQAQTRNKAIDTTADIVMEDYKMGDLKDRVYQGESMAPKLAPPLQKQADAMFSGRKSKSLPINAAAIARAAMAGAYAPHNTGGINPVAMQHKSGIRPPVKIINPSDGKR